MNKVGEGCCMRWAGLRHRKSTDLKGEQQLFRPKASGQALPRCVLQPKEHAAEVDGLGRVKILHAGVEELLIVIVEADASIVDLHEHGLLVRQARHVAKMAVVHQRCSVCTAGMVVLPAQEQNGCL